MDNLKQAALLAPFALADHSIRVMRKSKNNSALVAVYIDARNVQQRLDEVFDGEWSDTYTNINIHRVEEDKGTFKLITYECAAICRLVGDGIIHQDVGTGDGPDGIKGAYSDALKRAAVKFGIGRYLYTLKDETWYPTDNYGNLTPDSIQKAKANLARQLLVATGRRAEPEVDFERTYAQVHSPEPERRRATTPLMTKVETDPNFFEAETDANPFEDDDEVGFSGEAAQLIEWCQNQSSSDTRTPSMKQVDLVSKVIDRITGTEGSASIVLDALHATEGYSNIVVKELLDTLMEQSRDQATGTYVNNRNFNRLRVEAIKEIYGSLA